MSDYETWTRNEIALWPGVTAAFEKRAKHRQVVLAYRDQSRFVVYPDSPSDSVRGVHNHLGVVRRELSAMGAARIEREKARGPKRQRNPGAAARRLRVGERAPVRADPWDALRGLHDGSRGLLPPAETAQFEDRPVRSVRSALRWLVTPLPDRLHTTAVWIGLVLLALLFTCVSIVEIG